MNKDALFKALKSREIEPLWFETSDEALDYLQKELSGHKIVIGGCQTAKEIGLYDCLSKNNNVFWHWITNDLAARRAAEVEADIYIASANGISETGEIVNIDGSGNRVSNLAYGHETVIYIAGVNKVVPSLEDAIIRAKNVSAPLNSKKNNAKTPCAQCEENKCFDCRGPARNCRVMTITMYRPKLVKTMKLLLINEVLGF